MTLIRIAALSMLLGSALAALVWFAWGAIQSLTSGRKTTAAAPPAAGQEPKRERSAQSGKPA